MKRSIKVLFVQTLRSIYGMIESALLWYELFTTSLSYLRLKLNPYERCIANKVINKNQCTIGWFIYDNKFSQMDDLIN